MYVAMHNSTLFKSLYYILIRFIYGSEEQSLFLHFERSNQSLKNNKNTSSQKLELMISLSSFFLHFFLSTFPIILMTLCI